MTPKGFFNLAVESITAPREVARLLMSINMNREAILTAFALTIVLNTLVFGVTLLMAPASENVPFFLASPTGFLAAETVTLGGTILAFTIMGRVLGGSGRLADMALLMIWLQILNVLVQVFTIALIPVSEAMVGLVVLVSSGVGIWILVNFVAEAHGLPGLGRALAIVLLGLLALGFTLSLLLVFAGVSPEGIMGNV